MLPLNALGNNVSVDYSIQNNPVLQIPFSAIATAISWTNPPTAQTEKLEPWIAGILQVLANYSTDNPTNESSNIIVNQPTNNTPSTRNGIANRKNVRHIVTVYSENTINPIIDGDDL